MGYNSKILADAIKKLNERKVASKPKDIPLDVKGNGMLDPRFAGKPVKLNTDTLYNPTPYKIKAVADNGTERILNPFDESDVYFPGANTITEYPIEDYTEKYLTDEEIQAYRDGGYIVEEIPEMQPGGTWKPGTVVRPTLSKSDMATIKKEVAKAKPVALKLTGTVGQSSSSSKAPVKKVVGVTPSGKKVVTTVSTKLDNIDNKAKEDAAYEKFLDENLGKEGSNTYTYVDPITGKTEQREYSNDHLKEPQGILVDEATWNANRDRQNMQHLSEALSGVGEITGINSAIRTGERLIDDPLKFAGDLTTGISQAPETLVEGAMTLGSKLFGDNKDYVDVDTDALGVALDVAGALPVFGVAGKAAKPVLKTGLKYSDDVLNSLKGYRASQPSYLKTLAKEKGVKLKSKTIDKYAENLPESLIKRRLDEITNSKLKKRSIYSEKELEKKLKIDQYRVNKLKKQYPELDFNNPEISGYLFTNKEDIEKIPGILKSINQNKKSGESFAKYIKKDFDTKMDFIKNSDNKVLMNVVDESPQYLDEVYEHLRAPKTTDENFLNDLTLKSNTYTRFMKDDLSDLEYLNSLRGKNIDNSGFSMDVEGVSPSDFYGKYGYKVQPDTHRIMEIISTPLEKKWSKRIPTFENDVTMMPGMHTGRPSKVEQALRTRNERMNRLLLNAYEGEEMRNFIPTESFFNSTIKENLPKEFVESKYYTVPKHQVFNSRKYAQNLERFRITPLGKLEFPKNNKGYKYNEDYERFFEGTGKGFQEGGYINKMSKGGEAIKVINYLMSQGLTRQQASGIAGNLQQESSFRPNAKGSLGHVGIAQWDKNDRWPKVKKYIESQGLDPFSLDGQLAGLVWEAKKRKDWDKILKTKTPEESAQTWLKHFEISGEKPGQKGYDNRLKYAKSLATQRDPNSPFDESVRDLVRLEAYREGLKNKSSVTASNEIPYRGIRYNYPTAESSSNIDPLLTGAMNFNDDVTLDDIKPKTESSNLFASLLNMISAQEQQKEKEKVTEDPRQEILKLMSQQYPAMYAIGNTSHRSFENPFAYANDIGLYKDGGQKCPEGQIWDPDTQSCRTTFKGYFDMAAKAYKGSSLEKGVKQASKKIKELGDEIAKTPVGQEALKNYNEIIERDIIKLQDPRKTRATTGQAINPNRDLVSGEYNWHIVTDIINRAKKEGIDPYTALAIGLQESQLGKTDKENIGHSLYTNFKEDPYSYISFYKQKLNEADKANVTDEAARIQYYNGLGIVTPRTEKNYHGYEMQSIYGVPIPSEGINLKNNPLYGKQIIDLRDNVIKHNDRINQYIQNYKQKGGGVILELDDEEIKRYLLGGYNVEEY